MHGKEWTCWFSTHGIGGPTKDHHRGMLCFLYNHNHSTYSTTARFTHTHLTVCLVAMFIPKELYKLLSKGKSNITSPFIQKKKKEKQNMYTMVTVLIGMRLHGSPNILRVCLISQWI